MPSERFGLISTAVNASIRTMTSMPSAWASCTLNSLRIVSSSYSVQVHMNRFEGGRMYEYGVAIDKKYGTSWANLLYTLYQKIEPWETRELEQLRSAAKHSVVAHTKLYFTLRPHHRM